MFFRRLMPLLEFGREREGIDLSKVTLTHHALKTAGKNVADRSATAKRRSSRRSRRPDRGRSTRRRRRGLRRSSRG